jgi:SAM-dependent methyltransferase
MEEIRHYHNLIKRQLIQNATRQGDSVLDVGCGYGGDLKKWDACKVRSLDMCDPNASSLEEAQIRATKVKVKPNFYHGDILQCPSNKKYDIVCYNFSLHYIFENYKLFKNSIRAVKDRLKVGGKLIGVIPDSESVLMHTPFIDELGNVIKRNEQKTGYGNFGEHILVMLEDTPFYNGEFKPEPIAYKDLLITELLENGFMLESWDPLQGSTLSQLYSQFIFVRT